MSALSISPPVDAASHDPFAEQGLAAAVPTTEAQREIFLATQWSREASLAYNESITLDFQGPLDAPALAMTLQALVQRHDALRASFSADGQTLWVAESLRLDLPIIDVSAQAAAQQSHAWQQGLDRAATQPFDLLRGPLVRAELFRFSPRQHRLILCAHHIVCDGWSFGILVQECAQFYAATLQGAAPRLPQADSFTAYAARQVQPAAVAAAQVDAAYWVSQFSTSVVALSLPSDQARPNLRSFASRRLDVRLPADTLRAVRQLSATQGRSLYAVLLALFAGTLARLAGVAELVLGVSAAGQSSQDQGPLVGHCVSLLPVRLAVEMEHSAGALLQHVGGQLLDAFEHPTCTYGSLLTKLSLERDPARPALVSVLFNLDSAMAVADWGQTDLLAEVYGNPRQFETFDLFANLVPERDGLRLECQYNAHLFDDTDIQRWLLLYTSAVQRLVAPDAGPVEAVSLAPLLRPTDADLQRLAEFNRCQRVFDFPSTLAQAVERQVDANTQRLALRCGGQTCSYAQLDQRANALAHALRAGGIGRGSRVGLCLERSIDMLVGLLAILKAGAAYVPLDPGFPSQRLVWMAQDARLSLLLTQSNLMDRWQEAALDTWLIDAQPAPWAGQSVQRLAPDARRDARGEDPAYIILSSGSRGQPKVVMVTHRAVVNLLASMAEQPGLGPDDRLLAVTTLSFDIAVLELFLPLTTGAQVVLATRDQARDGNALIQQLEASAITVMQATPGTWRLLLAADWQPRPGFTALVGGEALPPDLADLLLVRCQAVWNLYGPTETTVWSTRYQLKRGDARRVPIGRPIANTRICVADAQQRLLPMGAVGEILIAGTGVALGYVGRDALSAERFVIDPLATQPGDLAYRTGDLGRWRADGLLECLGRDDQQVKLRGYRIELGEIEAQLLQVPGVAQAAVLLRKDPPGHAQLVAYVVSADAQGLESASLQASLRRTLPDYMLPTQWVALGALPLLPNGKLNRQALPAPAAGAGSARGRRAPATPLQKQIAAAMEAALSLPGLALDDDFFALGGHSLLALQLTRALSRALGRPVPLRAVFDAPTVERLSLWLEQPAAAPRDAARHITVHADQALAPASLQQQRLWFLEQFSPGRATYNTPSAHRLVGALNIAALEQSLQALVQRQAVLRTALTLHQGVPMQAVASGLSVTLAPLIDLRHLGSADRLVHLQADLNLRAAQTIDLRVAPLWRLALYQLADDEHVLFFMPHHAIWDGWSFDLLYRELSELYEAHVAQRAPALGALPVSYADFARWQQGWLSSADLQQQLSYWKRQFDSLPLALPLALPLDRPRPAKLSGAGQTLPIAWPAPFVQRLRAWSQEQGVTLFSTLLAAFSVWLCRHAQQPEVVIGTPVRGRDEEQTEALMGFFVNALPIRLRPDLQLGFGTWVAQVQAQLSASFAAPDVPFEHLVRELQLPRDESRSALYQTFFSYQDGRQRQRQWGGLKQSQIHVYQPALAEDLGLWLLEHAQGMDGGLSFSTDLFKMESVQRMLERLPLLLDSAMSAAEQPLSRLVLLPAAEQALMASWHATARPLPSAANVAALLHAQVARSPDQAALVHGSRRLTYAELDDQASALAAELQQRGLGRGALVGLCLRPGMEQGLAWLAVLRCGAAYVPLDPAYPAARLQAMVADARLDLLISQPGLDVGLAGSNLPCLWLDGQAQAAVAAPSVAAPSARLTVNSPDDPAYVIYTSGSSGQPKGVVVPHRGVLNLLQAMADRPGLRATDRLLALTSHSFDIAVAEWLLPWSVGATVVVADHAQTQDPQALAQLLSDHDITVMQATPSTWLMLVEAGWRGQANLRAWVGGETLPAELADQLLQRCAEVWNLYGPTETTVWSSAWQVQSVANGIRIGQPLDNTDISILDEHDQVCGIGVPGEICIGGQGVALGYLRQAALTAQRFTPDPNRPGHLRYRTGDLGRWHSDGSLEHLGRLDLQVKLRGHRVELGEIEATLLSHGQLAQAVVVISQHTAGELRLRACVVSREPGLSLDALRDFLHQRLPAYMLPSQIAFVSQLPRLPNGKVDRKAVAAMPIDVPSAAPLQSRALSSAEHGMAQLWSELLGTADIQADDNFYDLGGHSLLALRLVSEAQRRMGLTLELRRLTYESLAQLAATVPSARTEPAAAAPPGWLSRWFKGRTS